MDVKFKQRLKKRRTRKNLDKLRKKVKVTKELRNTISNNEPEHKRIANVHNQITSQRLTLALFNKTITSRTITRDPPSRNHSTCRIDKAHNGRTNNANCSGGSDNDLNNIVGINNNLNNLKQNINIKLGNLETHRLIEGNTNETNVTEIKLPYSAEFFIPSHFEDLDSSACKVSYTEFNPWHASSNSSHSLSKTEHSWSIYEKFMKELPRYLKEYFPSLTGEDSFHKTEVKQKYFKYQYKENDNSNCMENKISGNISKTHSPLDYLQMGTAATPQEQQNQRPVVSVSRSSSLYSSPYISNNLFLNSPEYTYFPHKLNE